MLSLSFAGINDLIFKKYSDRSRSVGVFVSIIGMVWSLFFIVKGLINETLFFNNQTIFIGLFAGITSVVANMLLIKAMKHTSASAGAMIYRLNIVFLAILAFLFLNEKFTFLKILSLGLAVLATYLISKGNNKQINQSLKNTYLF